MINRIYSCLFLMMLAVIISCSDDDGDKIKHFSAQVDAGNSSILDDKYNAIVVFSTDGGATWVDYPTLSPGEAYKAKVIYRNGANFAPQDIGDDGCYAFDWSASTPAPTGATNADVVDLVMQSESDLKVVVSDFKPYDAASWTGKWNGVEDGTAAYTDKNNITQDPANPNKFIMDNYWGDRVSAYFIMSPSTTWADQKLDLPQQTTDEGGIASGTGTYDQCRGVFHISARYILDFDPDHDGVDTTDFDYDFARP